MTFLLSELGNLFHQKVGDEMKEYIGDWLNVLMTLLLSTLTSCHLIVSSSIMASGRRRYARQMEYGMVLYVIEWSCGFNSLLCELGGSYGLIMIALVLEN